MNAVRRRLAAPAVMLVIIGLSAALMRDRLAAGRLVLDDFAYLAESRDLARTFANLGTPHNAHVVPLFRLWTWAVIALSGGPASWPTALTWSAFAALVLVMLAGGHLAATETRSTVAGLSAMAGLGITSVMIPAATWFAASQALWSGLLVMVMLLCLQGWRTRGGTWRLTLAVLAAAAASAFWSGGFVAGPAGAAYLWFSGHRHGRRAAFAPLLASLAYGLAVVGLSGWGLLGAGDGTASLIRLFRGLSHTAQAIPEVLVLGNLGIDATLAAVQGGVLSLVLAGLWLIRPGGVRRPGPLEAAGATIAVGGFALVYTFRGGFAWESVRWLGWYHALPQIGFVLLLAGWSGERPALDSRPRNWMVVALLAAALYLIHAPRAERLFVDFSRPLTERERAVFVTPELLHERASYFARIDHDRERDFLARLDRANALARRLGLGRADLRRALGRVEAPGWPPQVNDLDPLDLMDLPATGRDALIPPEALRSIRALLTVEPEPPTPWPDSP